MKLRNKKTGEIGYLIVGKGSDHYVVANNEWDSCGKYNSLAELNAEWEDVPEEPKEFWFIGEDCCPHRETFDVTKDFLDRLKEIGNYFETKEEAEKAVRKLKALKRLKDKGFRFEPVDRYEALCGNGFNIPITATMPPEVYTDAEVSKDLDICFGGEE